MSAPYTGKVTFEGDPEQARLSFTLATTFAASVEADRDRLGVAHRYGQMNLPNGGYVIAVSTGDYHATHMVLPGTPPSPDALPPVPDEVFEYVRVPDILSGVVSKNEIVASPAPDRIKELTLTEKSAQRFSVDQAKKILGIRESGVFSYLLGDNSKIESQFSTVRPSRYTGSMRKLVQLALGMGKHFSPTYEMRWMEQSPDSRDPLGDVLTRISDGKETTVISGFPAILPEGDPNVKETAIHYDWRHARTHGVSFAGDVPCIVQIGTSGIYAVPLFLDPVSKTVEGKSRYLDLYPELEEVFELFGGVPLMERFPSGDKIGGLESAIRAGEVVELQKGGGDFYSDKMPMFTGCGWAFNDRGTSAHNTCWKSGKDGYKESYHYATNISLSYNAPPTSTSENTAVAELLGANAHPVLLRKAYRLTKQEDKEQYAKLAEIDDIKERWRVFDAFTVSARLLSGSAGTVLQKSGKLYHHARKLNAAAGGVFGIPGAATLPQLKFPEVVLGGLMSFDFRPADEEPPPKAIKCDAPMFAFFNGDNLEVLNYVYKPIAPTTKPASTDQDPCQMSGDYTSESEHLDHGVQGNFYTSRFDDRRSVRSAYSSGSYRITTSGKHTNCRAHSIFSRCIDCSAVTDGWITGKQKAVETEEFSVSYAVPMGERNALSMLKVFHEKNKSESESGGPVTWPGGITVTYAVYHFSFHWVGSCWTTGSAGEPCARYVGSKSGDVCKSVEPAGLQYCVTDNDDAVVVTSNLDMPNGILGSNTIGFTPPPEPWNRSNYTNIYTFDAMLYTWVPEGGRKNTRKNVSGKDAVYLDMGVSAWWWLHSPTKDGASPNLYANSNCLGKKSTCYEHDFYPADGPKTTVATVPALTITNVPFGVL